MKEIDTMEARRQDHLEKAEALEGSIKTLRPENFTDHEAYVAEKDYRRKTANTARRSAQRAANKKIELGKALSAYRTMLLPMPENEDNSVAL